MLDNRANLLGSEGIRKHHKIAQKLIEVKFLAIKFQVRLVGSDHWGLISFDLVIRPCSCKQSSHVPLNHVNICKYDSILV